jgi:hypothetical protein
MLILGECLVAAVSNKQFKNKVAIVQKSLEKKKISLITTKNFLSANHVKFHSGMKMF